MEANKFLMSCATARVRTAFEVWCCSAAEAVASCIATFSVLLILRNSAASTAKTARVERTMSATSRMRPGTELAAELSPESWFKTNTHAAAATA